MLTPLLHVPFVAAGLLICHGSNAPMMVCLCAVMFLTFVTCALVCDIAEQRNWSLRLQPTTAVHRRQRVVACAVSCGNLLVTAPLFLWAAGVVMLPSLLEPVDVAGYTRSFRLLADAARFVLSNIVAEIVFYLVHLGLHHPRVYHKIHKMHHEFRAPVAAAALYAHPIEAALGNFAPIVVGAWVSGLPPVLCVVWTAISISTACLSHSGLVSVADICDFHDYHHLAFSANYGIGTHLCDHILKTAK